MAAPHGVPPTLPASLLRRLAAIVYDSLLLFGVLFVAAIPLVFIDAELRAKPVIEWPIRSYLLAVCFAYFVGFWKYGGQTLGMRAWRLRVVDATGKRPTTARLAARFGCAILSWAPLGAGYLWIALNRRREAFHDLMTGTFIIRDAAAKRGD